MINDLDRKLILALQQNGRASQVDLANQLGVHVSTVAKRIVALEGNETMKVRALPNPYKLGFIAHAFIAIEADSSKINSICDHLYKNFNVNLVVTTFGRFDILAIVYFSTWEKLLSFVFSDLCVTDGVKNVETFFVRDIKKRFYGRFFDNVVPAKIDETDLKIVERLTENGRQTAQQLAKELGISLPTCIRRLARLLDQNVMEVKAVPNPSRIGLAGNAFMLLKVEAAKLEHACAELKSYPGVFLVMTLFNSYDILIGFNAHSPEELHRFIKSEILAIDGIIRDETIIRAEIKKRYYGGFLQDSFESGPQARPQS